MSTSNDTRTVYEKAERGITKVHKRTCRWVAGSGRCNCKPGYRAEAWDNVAQRRVVATKASLVEAQRMRRDLMNKIDAGLSSASKAVPFVELAEEWIAKADAGVLRARSGDPFKPSYLRGAKRNIRNDLIPRFGRAKVSEIRRKHVQDYIDELVKDGALASSTIRSYVSTMAIVMRYGIRQEMLVQNPCMDLELPSGATARDRIAPVSEALLLLGALDCKRDRAVWALAFFTGLRRGEILGLTWANINLLDRTIKVTQSYDVGGGSMGLPKSKASARTVHIPQILLPYLLALDTTEGLLFPSTREPSRPMDLTRRRQRICKTWEDAGMEPIGLHECRHTYASLMIASGVNIKAISTYMGHASVKITWDRYGHLLPDAGREAMDMFDKYLEDQVRSIA